MTYRPCCGGSSCDRGCPNAGIPDTPESLITVPRKWLFGLTADEWFHLASEGDESEVAPCCGNLGFLRDALTTLTTCQASYDRGLQLLFGTDILQVVEKDGDNHHLADPEQYPLLARVCAGLRALQIGARTKTGKEMTLGEVTDYATEAERGYDIPGDGKP